MSGICGYIGNAPADCLDAMLSAIEYRGDSNATVVRPGLGFGYRFWKGRTAKAQEIFVDGTTIALCAGLIIPSISDPAEHLSKILSTPRSDLGSLDGGFAAAVWFADSKTLKLIRDPFGIRSLHYLEHDGVLYFSSELKQLLAIPGFRVEPDFLAIHKYLTFSFVPGDASAVRRIKRVPPGSILSYRGGETSIESYFSLHESIDSKFSAQDEAVRFIRPLCEAAVRNRLTGSESVGLYLSGGIDSSGVAAWLKREGVDVEAFTLNFGERSVEHEQAQSVAQKLSIRLHDVPVDPKELLDLIPEIVWKLDRPLGDAVTGPQYLLGRAAHQLGLKTVFNGEGGDQFFGGWSNKPMISATLYSGEYEEEETPEETYLKTYHRFYGLEDQLYTKDFRELVSTPGARRSHLEPYLYGGEAKSFLGKLRLADISLKGSQNILPRMERMTNCWGLDARVPFFDRALAMAAFTLPPQMKLHGACEKYVIKLILQKSLPHDIVWRRKYGMTVPVTDWVLGPLAPLIDEVLGEDSLRKRNMFSPSYVANLRSGVNEPNEVRRRRIGERIWTLLMLELWMRQFLDQDGRTAGI